jgi:hypothetical protein
MGWWWLPAALILGVVLLLALAWRPLQRWGREAQAKAARRLFTQQREHLEARFLQLVAASGKPRGLRWKSCDWDRGFELAREVPTGRLAALVGITVQFEAIEGGDMEGWANVGYLRNATAVFFFDRGAWQTAGKAVFNMNPDEAIRHHHYERIPS